MGISDGVSVEPDDPVAGERFAADLAERIRAGLDAVDEDAERVVASWRGQAGERFAIGWRNCTPVRSRCSKR